MRKAGCSTKGCKNKHRPGQRTCYPCHAEEQRAMRLRQKEDRQRAQEALARLLARRQRHAPDMVDDLLKVAHAQGG